MSQLGKRLIIWGYLGLVGIALAAALILYTTGPSFAADLGGNCCADLEERIADLEATAAKKGNRKLSLRVYGVVNEAVMHIDGDGIDSNWVVGRNSNVESFIGVAGSAVIMPRVTAGYVLEIGLGGSNPYTLGSPFAGDDNGTYTRRSFGYLKSEDLGQVTVGLDFQATHEISQLSTANTLPAARMLSLRPIVGPQVGEALDLFDGGRTNLVRYDTPELAGFSLSGSWAAGGGSLIGPTDDVWDIALRWHGQLNDFRAVAGIGYRSGIVIPTIGNLGAVTISGFDVLDPRVVSGSASIMHVPSGIFVNGAAGQLDLGGMIGDAVGNITAWSVQAGDEVSLTKLGKTTFYGEYADTNVDKFDVGLKYWGIGAVQHIDDAAFDLYASYRQYDLEGLNVNFFMAGAKIGF